MARRKHHRRHLGKHRKHSRRRSHSTLLGRASKHCAGQGKRARKVCMKRFFAKHK
jgi:hypothetical protein